QDVQPLQSEVCLRFDRARELLQPVERDWRTIPPCEEAGARRGGDEVSGSAPPSKPAARRRQTPPSGGLDPGTTGRATPKAGPAPTPDGIPARVRAPARTRAGPRARRQR